MTVDDLQGALSTEELEIHQDLQHTNGISSESVFNSLSPRILAKSNDVGEIIQLFTPENFYYYINGKRSSSLESNIVGFGTAPTEGSELHEIYIDKDRNVKASKRVKMPSDLNTDQGIEIVNVDPRIGVTAFTLKYTYTSDTNRALAISTDGGDTFGVAAPLLPNADVYYRIYDQTGVSWVDVAVKWTSGNLPTSSKTETGSFFAVILRETNLLIAAIVLSKRGEGINYFLGNLFSGDSVNARKLKDLRQWGSISQREITDEAKVELIELPRLELRSSGVARGLLVSALSGGVRVAGGIAYLNGKRFEVRTAELSPGVGTWHIVIPETGVPTALSASDVLRFKDRPYRRDAYVLLAIAEVVDGGGTTVTNVPLRIYSLDRKLPTVVVAQRTGEGHFSVEEDGQSAIQRGIDYLFKNSETGGTVFIKRGSYPGNIRIPSGIQLIGEGEDTILVATDTNPVIADANDTLNRSAGFFNYGLPGTIKSSTVLYTDLAVFGSSILVGDTIYIYSMNSASYGFYTVEEVMEGGTEATLSPEIQDAISGTPVSFAKTSTSIGVKNLTINGAAVESGNSLARFFAVKDISLSNITFKNKSRSGGTNPSHLQLDECYLGSVSSNRIRQPADASNPESLVESERSGLDGITGQGCRHIRFEHNIIENMRRAIDLYFGGGCTLARNFIAKCEWGISIRNQSVVSMLALTGGNSPIPSGTLTTLTGILPSGPSGIIQIGQMLSALRVLRLTGNSASISDISGISGFFYGLSGPGGITGLSGIRRIRKHPPFRPRRGLAFYGQLFGNPARFGEAPGPGGSVTTLSMQATAAQIAAQEGFSVLAENIINEAVITKGDTGDVAGSYGRAIYLYDSAGIIVANNSIMTYVQGIRLSGAQTTANMFIGNNFDARDEETTIGDVPAEVFLDEARGTTSMTSNIFAQNHPPDGQRQLLFADTSGVLTYNQSADNFRGSNLDFDTIMNLGIDSDDYGGDVKSFTGLSKYNAGRFLLDFAKAFLAEHNLSGTHGGIVHSINGQNTGSTPLTGAVQLGSVFRTISSSTYEIMGVPTLNLEVEGNGAFTSVLNSATHMSGRISTNGLFANLPAGPTSTSSRFTLSASPSNNSVTGPALLLGIVDIHLLNTHVSRYIVFSMDVYTGNGSTFFLLNDDLGTSLKNRILPIGSQLSSHSEFISRYIPSGETVPLNNFYIELVERSPTTNGDLLTSGKYYSGSVTLVVISPTP